MNNQDFEKPKDDTPNEIKVTEHRDDFISLKLSAQQLGALQIFLGYPIFIIGVIGFFVIPFAMQQLIGWLFGLIFFVGCAWIYGVMASKETPIKVTPTAITIGKKNYDRDLWAGFRIGDDHAVKGLNAQHLEFSYGGNIEKTGLSFGFGRVTLIAAHLNALVDSVARETAAASSPTPEYKF